MTSFDYITDIGAHRRRRATDAGSHTDPALAAATTGAGGRAGIAYLHPISLAGNNLTLIAVPVAAGLTLGTLNGMTILVSGNGATAFHPAPAS